MCHYPAKTPGIPIYVEGKRRDIDSLSHDTACASYWAAQGLCLHTQAGHRCVWDSADECQNWAKSINSMLCSPVLSSQVLSECLGLLQISRVKALPIATLYRAAARRLAVDGLGPRRLGARQPRLGVRVVCQRRRPSVARSAAPSLRALHR